MIEVYQHSDDRFEIVLEGILDESRTVITLSELVALYDALYPFYEKEVIHGG